MKLDKQHTVRYVSWEVPLHVLNSSGAFKLDRKRISWRMVQGAGQVGEVVAQDYLTSDDCHPHAKKNVAHILSPRPVL